MADWKSIDIVIDEDDLKSVHYKVCEAISARENSEFWIAEVDTTVIYKVFSSINEMAECMWYEWPGNQVVDFIEEFKLSDQAPVIVLEHSREYYVLKTSKHAEDFLRESVEVISNNPFEEEEEETTDDE